jgi:hypothetical protein
MLTFPTSRLARTLPAVALAFFVPLTAGCADDAVAPLTARASVDPLEVAVAPVAARDQAVTIEATGSFVADEQSDVAPEVSGRVLETLVDVGHTVRPGQPLIRIQGIDAGSPARRGPRRGRGPKPTVRLTESQNNLAQTTAQRYARCWPPATSRRRWPTRRGRRPRPRSRAWRPPGRRWPRPAPSSRWPKRPSPTSSSRRRSAGYISARNVSLGEYVQPSTRS